MLQGVSDRLILAHLERLPDLHQSVLRYASVLGGSVDAGLLKRAFPEIDLEESLRQLGV